MPLISDKDRQYIKKKFENLVNDVRIIYFTQETECAYCRETRDILTELSSLSDKLSLTVYDFVKDKEQVEKYGIDKIPATVLTGEKDYGIRYYGIPSGYEFGSLVDDIIDVSRGDSGLCAESKELLKAINKKTHIQVFVTPTCPYCPMAVRMAHKIAIESEYVTADMIESTEFPYLAAKYKVFAVPKTVINEEFSFEGGQPEKIFVQKVIDGAMGK